jgi:hypothetical protein
MGERSLAPMAFSLQYYEPIHPFTIEQKTWRRVGKNYQVAGPLQGVPRGRIGGVRTTEVLSAFAEPTARLACWAGYLDSYKKTRALSAVIDELQLDKNTVQPQWRWYR